MINPEFWRGKRVFLTGHTGFKGSWLSLWLQQLGAEVTGFSLPPPTQPSLFELAHVEKGMTSLIGDIRDLGKLSSALQESKAEIVFHLAAQPLVRLSYNTPVDTYSTNVMGTVNLLESVRRSNCVRSAVIVTTDKCYENREWVWGYREDEPMGGHDPYSNSKGCAELVVSGYRKSFFSDPKGPQIASARAGNVIGGGDFAEDRLIPDIVRAALSKQKLMIRNPNATRPWQHVLEPLSGYLLLAERLYQENGSNFAEGWNFGPKEDSSASVKEVIELIQSILPLDKALEIATNKAELHEANFLRLDVSKAISKLKWRPNFNLDSAIKWTIDWYFESEKTNRARELTLNQIQIYEQSAIKKKW
jgi:CDP-glucose 4,6-dehydratase